MRQGFKVSKDRASLVELSKFFAEGPSRCRFNLYQVVLRRHVVSEAFCGLGTAAGSTQGALKGGVKAVTLAYNLRCHQARLNGIKISIII